MIWAKNCLDWRLGRNADFLTDCGDLRGFFKNIRANPRKSELSSPCHTIRENPHKISVT
jgi:hypothetical protein